MPSDRRESVHTVSRIALQEYNAKMDNEPNPTNRQHATAFHEAGHAVMAIALGRPVKKVTIAPGKLQFGGTRLGLCEIQKGRFKPTDDWLEDEVVILLAGMVAESHFTGEYCPNGARQDLLGVGRLLGSRAASDRQFEKLQRRMLAKTEHILAGEAFQKAIEWTAQELVQKTTISGRAVRHFYHQAMQQFT